MSYKSGIGLEWKKIQKSLKKRLKKKFKQIFSLFLFWTNKKVQLFQCGFYTLDHLLFILMSFLNKKSYDNQHGPISKIFRRALKRSWILLCFSHLMNVKHWKTFCLFFYFATVRWKLNFREFWVLSHKLWVITRLTSRCHGSQFCVRVCLLSKLRFARFFRGHWL